VDAGYAVGPRDAPGDRTNWAAGVVPLKNGRASWRNAEGGGVDLERRGGGWRVTQVGHSVCEDCAFDVDVSGDFHRTHIRFPSVSGPY
jgi:hypothetical protein